MPRTTGYNCRSSGDSSVSAMPLAQRSRSISSMTKSMDRQSPAMENPALLSCTRSPGHHLSTSVSSATISHTSGFAQSALSGSARLQIQAQDKTCDRSASFRKKLRLITISGRRGLHGQPHAGGTELAIFKISAWINMTSEGRLNGRSHLT